MIPNIETDGTLSFDRNSQVFSPWFMPSPNPSYQAMQIFMRTHTHTCEFQVLILSRFFWYRPPTDGFVMHTRCFGFTMVYPLSNRLTPRIQTAAELGPSEGEEVNSRNGLPGIV